MSRLQKKCFIGATGMHVVLLGLLFAGPAFLAADRVDDSPVLEIIPDLTTDRDVKGGGNPAPQPATPAVPPAQPRQEEPRPPTPVPRVQKPEPQKPERTEPRKADKADDARESKDKKPAHEVRVGDKVVRMKDRNSSSSTAERQAAARAAAQRSQRYANAARALRSQLSQTTTIEAPTGGFGGGGPSYANYTQVVRKIYNDAWNAWSVPDDVTDDEASVRVSVTIARDGRVISSRILQSSGSRAVIAAAQAVLDRVTSVKPFPADSKDSERTFTMTFKLNSKKATG